MPVQIKQLHRHFAGEVSGVDLSKSLTPQEAADIEAGMDRYAVLVFHGQDITDDQQMAFAPLPNFAGSYPVVGSWLVDHVACGLSIREDENPITGNTSRFLPHAIL